MSPRTNTVGNGEPMEKGNTTKRIVTIQTTVGCYEATLTEDNKNNFPIQKQLELPRYRISNPPMMMRSIPKYHKTKQLQE